MFSSIRGTKDILPKDQKYWDYFKRHAFKQADIYGFERIETPTFETTDLFLRGIGMGTDIVTKETYSFLDRGLFHANAGYSKQGINFSGLLPKNNPDHARAVAREVNKFLKMLQESYPKKLE